jgi:hypothetical protein
MEESKVENLVWTEEQWEKWVYSLIAEIENAGVAPVYRPPEPVLEKPDEDPYFG